MLWSGKQRGGAIHAQNGTFVGGNSTGDRHPALLESGEYVLNRNAVGALGGPQALNSINFGMAPRFQKRRRTFNEPFRENPKFSV